MPPIIGSPHLPISCAMIICLNHYCKNFCKFNNFGGIWQVYGLMKLMWVDGYGVVSDFRI